VTSDIRFLYDAWNLLAEIDMSPSLPVSSSPRLLRSYAWGYDLSGSEQGAGGVGGLVLVSSPSSILHPPSANASGSTLAPAYDGNGNIHAYLDCATGSPTQRMEYDAFGNEMTLDSVLEGNATTASTTNHEVPFRFSTKYTDSETGLSYYGYRYYSAEMGRWPSRDPIGERGGINLYGMIGNDAVNRVDVLGLQPSIEVQPKQAPKECCDKKGVKATNCFEIIIWASAGGSMAFGHASFGLPGQTMYGFHGDGYKDDDVDMKGYKKSSHHECCCLTDDEMNALQKKIKAVQDKIAKKDKTDLSGNEYSVFDTSTPNPTCSGSAAGFAGGMGCPNVKPSDGSYPGELQAALNANKHCKAK
jgi:RHS repeat-associated protein